MHSTNIVSIVEILIESAPSKFHSPIIIIVVIARMSNKLIRGNRRHIDKPERIPQMPFLVKIIIFCLKVFKNTSNWISSCSLRRFAAVLSKAFGTLPMEPLLSSSMAAAIVGSKFGKLYFPYCASSAFRLNYLIMKCVIFWCLIKKKPLLQDALQLSPDVLSRHFFACSAVYIKNSARCTHGSNEDV